MALEPKVGERYVYRPKMLVCEIIRVDGNRQRLHVKLVGSDQDFQEVPYHDILDLPAPPHISATPVGKVTPEQKVIDEQLAEGGTGKGHARPGPEE